VDEKMEGRITQNKRVATQGRLESCEMKIIELKQEKLGVEFREEERPKAKTTARNNKGKTISLTQQTLELQIPEEKKPSQTKELVVMNESFYKKGYLERRDQQEKEEETRLVLMNEKSFKKGSVERKVIDIFEIREEMLNKGGYLKLYEPPEKMVFKLEKQLREENKRPKNILDSLKYPFGKHNLTNKQLELILKRTENALNKKKRIILPSQLITLAALNQIDEYLDKPNTSNKFFKTRVLSELRVGRRASATRELKRKGYIRSFGNRWKRTKKEFDETDFCLEEIGRAK
jgi:hypothetical protein